MNSNSSGNYLPHIGHVLSRSVLLLKPPHQQLALVLNPCMYTTPTNKKMLLTYRGLHVVMFQTMVDYVKVNKILRFQFPVRP